MPKDFKGVFTNASPSLALFESHDAIDWRPTDHTLVSTLQIAWDDGEVQSVKHLERPQFYIEGGVPRVLFCACVVDQERSYAFNVHIPLEGKA